MTVGLEQSSVIVELEGKGSATIKVYETLKKYYPLE
jgi:hypothetical protein